MESSLPADAHVISAREHLGLGPEESWEALAFDTMSVGPSPELMEGGLFAEGLAERQRGHDWQERPGVQLRETAAASVQGESVKEKKAPVFKRGSEESWVCAICHCVIPLANTAVLPACEHPYCANCILQWASYKDHPWCPQCRVPFSSLALFRRLDGSLGGEMQEESVCLLLRAPWFVPLEVPDEADAEDADAYDDEYDEEEYYRATLRIGNRRWGENGYVRGGRMEARVTLPGAGAGPSSSGNRSRNAARSTAAAAVGGGGHGGGGAGEQGEGMGEKEGGLGRRAKRAQKREEADKQAGRDKQPARQQQQQQRKQKQGQQRAPRGARLVMDDWD